MYDSDLNGKPQGLVIFTTDSDDPPTQVGLKYMLSCKFKGWSENTPNNPLIPPLYQLAAWEILKHPLHSDSNI